MGTRSRRRLLDELRGLDAEGRHEFRFAGQDPPSALDSLPPWPVWIAELQRQAVGMDAKGRA